MENTDEMLALAERAISQRFEKTTTLKDKQRDVLRALAARKNVFAGLPTGFGKSLCYWAPAAAWGWRVWVISPLVSLIQDQALACEDLGLKVTAWHGGLSEGEREQLSNRMRAGNVEVVFLSPERLSQWWADGFLAELEFLGVGPSLLALDEMHCFEEWRSFREGYSAALEPVRRLLLRGVPLLGLSASLSRQEAEAWMNELCETHVYIGTGLGRDNLHLNVVAIEEEEERWIFLLAALRGLRAPESALVYCATREEADQVASWLTSAGVSAVAYHAGHPPLWKEARSRAFRAGKLRVVCATTAFGMGIDYASVSRVIHFSTPYSLESYWQEVGRAGRGGDEAWAMAFWARSSVVRARLMDLPARQKYFHLWEAWASGMCRKRAVELSLGREDSDCGRCDRCRAQAGNAKRNRKNFSPRSREWLKVSGVWNREDPWWVEKEAKLRDWAKGKIFGDHEKS